MKTLRAEVAMALARKKWADINVPITWRDGETVPRWMLCLDDADTALEVVGNKDTGTEWFWRVVDANGLSDLPSDEEDALRLILKRGGFKS